MPDSEIWLLRNAALAYAQRGIPVFPVWGIVCGICACGRRDCGSAGKHPHGRLAPRGLKDATTDLNLVERWWSASPSANIGMPTGAASGYDVVDIDPRNLGDVRLRELEADLGPIQCRRVVATGGGGWHYYFRHLENMRCGVNGPGIDIKGDGGYVLVPPSLHKSGARYELSEQNQEIAWGTMPQWLWPYKPTVPTGEPQAADQPSADGAVWKAPPGMRNNILFRYALNLRKFGVSRDELLSWVLFYNERHIEPPLGVREASRIAESAARYAPYAPDGILRGKYGSGRRSRDQDPGCRSQRVSRHRHCRQSIPPLTTSPRRWNSPVAQASSL